MSETTPKHAEEFCIPNWYGQRLERTTVLNTAHIATLNAALTGIHAVVDVLHDREAQRCEGEAMHCPTRNMGLLAAIHSLTTLVRIHTNEHEEDLPDFIRDAQGVQEVRSAAYGHWVRRTMSAGETAKRVHEHENHLAQQRHAQQAQAAINPVAKKRAVNTSSSNGAEPIK